MKRPIGIFDSGLGGLSVVADIRRQLPHESLIYVADSRHCPYGEKSEDFVRARAEAIGDFLVGEGCKAIIVACNTATAAAVAMLRSRFELPVVAVEPALKPAAAMTRSGVIGVLATRSTLQSPAYARLLAGHARHHHVIGESCPEWVDAVERGAVEDPATAALVAARVQPLLARGADVLVLGCTHFPFLRPHIVRCAGDSVTILETGPAVARRLRARLSEAQLVADAATPRHRFLSSQPTRHGETFARSVLTELELVESFTV